MSGSERTRANLLDSIGRPQSLERIFTSSQLPSPARYAIQPECNDVANDQQDDKDKDADAEEAPKAASGKIVTCRLCKGNHMTFKCPFKDQLAALDQVEGENDPAAAGSSTSKAPGTGKYVPP